MKTIRFMLLLSFIGIIIMLLVVACKVKTTKQEAPIVDTVITWETASFYPQYVMQLVEAVNSKGENCYWMVYDDIDAGFDNEIISMDAETFYKVNALWTIKDKNELNKLLDEYDFTIYNNNGDYVLLEANKD